MKVTTVSMLAVACLALTLGTTGCKHRPTGITHIPGIVQPPPPGSEPKELETAKTQTAPTVGLGTTVVEPTTKVETSTIKPEDGTGNIPAAGWTDIGDYLANRTIFEANTVYFDFDRHEVKSSERVKVEEVGVYLKGDPKTKLLVEGHCDERGTEEYNRALGERRALSVREYLVNLGVAAERVQTISYGEDQPAVPGHNEAAWARNRRGVFVLLKPKQ